MQQQSEKEIKKLNKCEDGLPWKKVQIRFFEKRASKMKMKKKMKR